jgi:hypothetical protein
MVRTPMWHTDWSQITKLVSKRQGNTWRRSRVLTIDDKLSPLQPMVEEAYEKAIAADWNNDPKATFLWQEYRKLKEKLEKGELYEPRF